MHADDAFGLGADINKDAIAVNVHNSALHYVAFAKGLERAGVIYLLARPFRPWRPAKVRVVEGGLERLRVRNRRIGRLFRRGFGRFLWRVRRRRFRHALLADLGHLRPSIRALLSTGGLVIRGHIATATAGHIHRLFVSRQQRNAALQEDERTGHLVEHTITPLSPRAAGHWSGVSGGPGHVLINPAGNPACTRSLPAHKGPTPIAPSPDAPKRLEILADECVFYNYGAIPARLRRILLFARLGVKLTAPRPASSAPI